MKHYHYRSGKYITRIVVNGIRIWRNCLTEKEAELYIDFIKKYKSIIIDIEAKYDFDIKNPALREEINTLFEDYLNPINSNSKIVELIAEKTKDAETLKMLRSELSRIEKTPCNTIQNVKTKKRENKKKRENEKKAENIEPLREILNMSFSEIEKMTGRQFENYCINLLDMSCLFPGAQYSTTKITGDFGADILIHIGNKHIITVQCKKITEGNIGVKAVQEVVTSKSYYQANDCIVITNSKFTRNAIELAKKNNVLLIDKLGIQRLLNVIRKNNNYADKNYSTCWSNLTSIVSFNAEEFIY